MRNRKSAHDLPPWKARNPLDQKLMVDWVNFKLGIPWPLDPDLARPGDYVDAVLLTAARAGDIEPLRKHYPRLAPFLHLPKQGRGKYPRLRSANYELRSAVADVKAVRALWKKAYNKKNRRADDGPSAEQIAADRWEVDIEDLVKRLKHFPRP